MQGPSRRSPSKSMSSTNRLTRSSMTPTSTRLCRPPANQKEQNPNNTSADQIATALLLPGTVFRDCCKPNASTRLGKAIRFLGSPPVQFQADAQYRHVALAEACRRERTKYETDVSELTKLTGSYWFGVFRSTSHHRRHLERYLRAGRITVKTACSCCPERGRGAKGVFHELHIDNLSVPDFRKDAER